MQTPSRRLYVKLATTTRCRGPTGTRLGPASSSWPGESEIQGFEAPFTPCKGKSAFSHRTANGFRRFYMENPRRRLGIFLGPLDRFQGAGRATNSKLFPPKTPLMGVRSNNEDRPAHARAARVDKRSLTDAAFRSRKNAVAYFPRWHFRRFS